MTVYDNLKFPAHSDRPHLIIDMVTTVDGKAVAPDEDHPLFGGKADRSNMLALRAQADALIYGATTGKDVPPEEFLKPDFQAARRKVGREPLIKYVLFSHRGSLSDSDKAFSDPEVKPVVYVPEGTGLELKNAWIREVGKGNLDVTAILRELKSKGGVNVALCEGGPTTNQPLLEAGLVDEFFVTVSPQIYGGKPIRTIVEGDLLPPDKGQLELVSAKPEGDEVFLRYRVKHK
jgi:riboflavin biosynthesis pyrimidine reductase